MTHRTFAILFTAGLLGACGGSTGSDLFGDGGAGGSGGSGATTAGGSSAGGSSASGGSAGDGGSGNTGNTSGDGGVGGTGVGANGGSAGEGASGGVSGGGAAGTSTGGAGNAGGDAGSAGGGAGGTASTTGGTGGSMAGTGGSAGSTAGTGGSTAGTGGTGGGTVKGDPGAVTCNGSSCRVDQGNKCCVPWYGSNPTGTCIAEDADCDGNGFQDLKNDITCNGPEDCDMGQHCCGETTQVGFGGSQRTVYDTLTCKSSCGNGEVVVCGEYPSECGPNQVCAQSALLESGYKVCRNP